MLMTWQANVAYAHMSSFYWTWHDITVKKTEGKQKDLFDNDSDLREQFDNYRNLGSNLIKVIPQGLK
jgi:hypothetical protein